ncbi:MAG: hypothetical protein U5J63_08265 [Fodinibius sp.]|nr:hypothetical protein [Fodinibius sp.]
MNTEEAIKNVKLVGGSLALLSVAGIAYAVRRGLNHRRMYSRPFDAKNVEEFEGKILSVEHSNEKKDEMRGIYLNLQTEDEVIDVHLGPAWYISHQDGKFKAGEKVEVIGSRVNYNRHEAITALSIIRGEEELKLRDEQGTPYWHGWQKRAR